MLFYFNSFIFCCWTTRLFIILAVHEISHNLKLGNNDTSPTLDGRKSANHLMISLSHYLKGFLHPRWCKTSSIKSSKTSQTLNTCCFNIKGIFTFTLGGFICYWSVCKVPRCFVLGGGGWGGEKKIHQGQNSCKGPGCFTKM